MPAGRIKILRREFDSAVLKYGFCGWGSTHIPPVHPPVHHSAQKAYRNRMQSGMLDPLSYLHRAEMRFDPGFLLPDCRTIIAFADYYMPETARSWLSVFAQGIDYHTVIPQRLKMIAEETGISGRICTDSAPLLEKYWASVCGLGFIGKNTLLITPNAGSWVFLGFLLSNDGIDFRDDGQHSALMKTDVRSPNSIKYAGRPGLFCGDCRKCIDACPVRAITAPGVLDTRRCIACSTVELGADSDYSFFGCDICQRVCPLNNGIYFSKPVFSDDTGNLENSDESPELPQNIRHSSYDVPDDKKLPLFPETKEIFLQNLPKNVEKYRHTPLWRKIRKMRT